MRAHICVHRHVLVCLQECMQGRAKGGLEMRRGKKMGYLARRLGRGGGFVVLVRPLRSSPSLKSVSDGVRMCTPGNA